MVEQNKRRKMNLLLFIAFFLLSVFILVDTIELYANIKKKLKKRKVNELD